LRGCGLSDRDVSDFSLERLAEDFEAVVVASGVDRFVFMGTAANVAAGIAHAVVISFSRLVLYACHTPRNLMRPHTPVDMEVAQTRPRVCELGWTNLNSGFGRS
jgi:pimeloyl-ACP methyl ester carboxylesterase